MMISTDIHLLTFFVSEHNTASLTHSTLVDIYYFLSLMTYDIVQPRDRLLVWNPLVFLTLPWPRRSECLRLLSLNMTRWPLYKTKTVYSMTLNSKRNSARFYLILMHDMITGMPQMSQPSCKVEHRPVESILDGSLVIEVFFGRCHEGCSELRQHH